MQGLGEKTHSITLYLRAASSKIMLCLKRTIACKVGFVFSAGSVPNAIPYCMFQPALSTTLFMRSNFARN